MALSSPTLIITTLTLLTLYVLRHFLAKSNARPLPPGPKGLPIFGNVADMPKPGVLEFNHWLKHKDLYGPISSVTVLGQTFIIINDAQIALELLRDRSAIHSSRPGLTFSGKMVGWKNATAFSPYNDYWKQHRTTITKIASSNVSVSVFDRVQEKEAAHFLLNMLRDPEDLFGHIRKEAGSVILRITYGYNPIALGNDPLVDLAGKTMADFADATVPGKYLVDIFPFLRHIPSWLPGTSFKRTAHHMRTQLLDCANRPFNFVQQQMRSNKHKPSFLSQAISKNASSDPEEEFITKWAALSLYLGGADTTVSSLMTFFLAMTVFPDIQLKAREELDRVVGNARLPVSSDRGQLPYIEAVMKETHRWHLVLPMGLPHCSTEEDVCRGWRIPKGAVLLANSWWFTHDPSVYPDPMTFRPERHISTPIHAAEPDPRNYIYGYGRRICPGRYVADNALFITMAQSLAVFKIEKLVENGKTVEPEVKFEPGAISHPLSYRTKITPRSEAHRRLVGRAEVEYPWMASDAEALHAMA